MYSESDIFTIDTDSSKTDLPSNDMSGSNESQHQELFSFPYHLAAEMPVSPKGTCILHLCCSSGTKPMIACGLLDYTCVINDSEMLTQIHRFDAHEASISNIKFSPQNENLLYTGSTNGTVKLWDLRRGCKCVKEFHGSEQDSQDLKPLLNFDVSSNDMWVCGCTEVVNGDAYLLFWDVQSSKLLGGYWESHTDDITQVKFHPTNNNKIATGSTDGLMNIFDISQSSEDDALLCSMNTESSVDKIGWFSYGSSDALYCITHTQVLQLWDTTEALPYAQFSREKITEKMQCDSSEDSYLVNVHTTRNPDKLLVLCGSTQKQREYLRVLELQRKKMKPFSCLKENKQIVQASWYDEENGNIITGGEGGLLHIWKSDTGYESSDTKNNCIARSDDIGLVTVSKAAEELNCTPMEKKAKSKFSSSSQKYKPY